MGQKLKLFNDANKYVTKTGPVLLKCSALYKDTDRVVNNDESTQGSQNY